VARCSPLPPCGGGAGGGGSRGGGSRRSLTAALLLSALAACGGHPAAPAPAPGPAPQVTAAAGGEGAALLPVRYDAASGKVFLTVRHLGEDLLYLNTLAGGLGTTSPLLDRGQVGGEAVVRFERHGNRVLLVRQNTAHRAVTDDEALRRSVEESFPRSVLAAFPIQREEGGALVVDATDFFLSDVYDVIGSLRAAGLGTVRLDRERSFVDAERTRSFPRNTEVRATLSYAAEAPHPELRRHAPDGRTLALQQHHSFLALPEPAMRPREFHPQAGIFANTFLDFAQPFDADYRRRQLVRWRLEPRDTAAYLRGELTEPVRPIVYYLDPAIPEPYRGAFREGGMWWNRIFEAAGFRDAFRIEDLPAGVDPMDARANFIAWVHRRERGPSVGPSYRDPRTGEILKTVVRMDSYRSLVNHDIYMGLVPAAGSGGLQISAEEFAMARRRQHTAHEIGHTLGLAHNFIAATQGRSSVMDYPVALVRLDAQGRIDISDAYRPSGGAHDSLAIRYAYTWFPTPEAEAAGLEAILRDARARGLRFVGDRDAPARGSLPAATQWVEGDDMLGALERTRAVRRVLIDRFDESAALPGEPLSLLDRRFAHVYLHHRSALQGATKYVGGMDFSYSMRGDGTEPTRVVAPADQRRALRLVLGALEPAELRIPDRVAALIPPSPFGWDGSERLITPTAAAFDPVAAAHSLAQEIVDGLLHPERAARLVAFHLRDPRNPSLDEVLGGLVETTWGAPPGAPADAALRRVAQRAVLDGVLDLAGSPNASAEVRAVAELHLSRLEERTGATRAAALPAVDRAHRAAARRDIRRYFEGHDDRERRPRPAPIPLPWP
jgi:hypothetical protein